MPHSLFDLTGRVALVSGAAQGIGRSMSLAFAEAGAELMLADINETGAQRTAREIETLGRRAVPVRGDVSEPDQIRALFEQPDDEFGCIDVLANVAGGASIETRPPEETPLEDVASLYAVPSWSAVSAVVRKSGAACFPLERAASSTSRRLPV